MERLQRLYKVGLTCVVAVLVSCQGGNNSVFTPTGGDTVRFKYATLLTVVKYADHTHVEVHNPWVKGKLLGSYDVSKPIEKVVVGTTAHCRLLSWLDADTAIAGVCDARYINVDAVKAGLAAGRIADCGNGMNPMVERIAEIGADAVMVSPYENSGGYGQLDKLGVPLVEVADYMEPSPLARAEWMRLYGILFGREQLADSLFHVVDSAYCSLRDSAAKLPAGRSMLVERKTGSVWYCPGGKSTIGQLIADANGQYVWRGDTHSGSLTLTAEQVIHQAANVDVWLFVYGGKTITRRDLLDEYEGYATLRAYREGGVYGCNADSVHYFEEMPFRPDYLLRDIIHIAHPDAFRGNLRYYKPVE